MNCSLRSAFYCSWGQHRTFNFYYFIIFFLANPFSHFWKVNAMMQFYLKISDFWVIEERMFIMTCDLCDLIMFILPNWNFHCVVHESHQNPLWSLPHHCCQLNWHFLWLHQAILCQQQHGMHCQRRVLRDLLYAKYLAY